MARYAVVVHTPEHLGYFAYLLAGLFELEHQGVVTLAVRLAVSLPEVGPAATRVDLTDIATGATRAVVFELQDSADRILPVHWRDVDVLFKRSFEPAVVARLVPPEHRHKVLPLGLFYNVRSRHEHDLWRFFAGLGLHGLRALVTEPTGTGLRRVARTLRRVLPLVRGRAVQRAREFATSPYLDEVVRAPSPETEPIVLFQPRVFAPFSFDPPEFLASKVLVNAQRAELVRRLRAALGPRFVGGIVSDDFARRHYSDVLFTGPTDRRSYLASTARARVVVYTEGLVGSAARKLGEYLATGRAIVMERLPATLPSPLVDGEHALVFDDLDTCVARCVELVDDPARARSLGLAAFAYHERWVTPAASVLRMLELATAIKPA